MTSLLQRIGGRFKRKNQPCLENLVLVYQMGKVASASIHQSLLQTNVNVIRLHRMNPRNIKAVKQEHLLRKAAPLDESLGLYVYEHLKKSKKPAKIISLIREPVGRNISAYFQNLDSFEQLRNAHSHLEVDELMNHFFEKYNHDVPLNWFDIEMKTTTGIDVFNYEFPKDKGFRTIHCEPYDLLLMRYDLTDDMKADLISNFLDLTSFAIIRKNEGMSKSYAKEYKELLSKIKVPAAYVERMLASKYVHHFFSDDELESIRKNWMRL